MHVEGPPTLWECFVVVTDELRKARAEQDRLRKMLAKVHDDAVRMTRDLLDAARAR